MIQQINTIQDIVTFMKQIAGEITDFHPMEDFSRYVDPTTNLPRYTKEEAAIRNGLIDSCINVCVAQDADFFSPSLDFF